MIPQLRRVAPEDSDQLFAWVNSPDSLAGKLLTAGSISRAEHEAWLARRLADPGTAIWIVETERGAAGQVRFEKKHGAWEVDVFIDRTFRGLGLASEALRRAESLLRRETDPLTSLRALVRTDNAASRRLFESLDYECAAVEADHLVFLRRPETESPHES